MWLSLRACLGGLPLSARELAVRAPQVDCWDFVYAGCLDKVKCEVMLR
jgi:hypothetical protein